MLGRSFSLIVALAVLSLTSVNAGLGETPAPSFFPTMAPTLAPTATPTGKKEGKGGEMGGMANDNGKGGGM